MPYLYKLPQNHNQIFKTDSPVSLPYLLRTIFDYWKIPRFNSDYLFKSSCINFKSQPFSISPYLDDLFRKSGELYTCLFFERDLVSEEKKLEFRDKYVFLIKTLDIFPKGTFLTSKVIEDIKESLSEKEHQKLLISIEKEGIKNPITIVHDHVKNEKYIFEGKHRANIALLLGIELVPCFSLNRVAGEELHPGWWVTFWEFMDIVRRNIQAEEQDGICENGH